jgi:uncharacterized membrane protein (UPF0127 family)
MRWIVLALLCAAGLIAGCEKKSSTPAAPTPGQPAQHVFPTSAQSKLQTIRLWMGPEELETELALTPIQSETGMMFRTNMPENTAMLFVFPRPFRASFWMKNTILPLSAAYIDPDGIIQEIHDLQPQDTNAVTADSNNILYVLEVNQGWFQRHHIATGTLIRSEYGSLPETFTKRRP